MTSHNLSVPDECRWRQPLDKKKRVRRRECKRYTLWSFSSLSILKQQPSTEVLLVRRRKRVCSMTWLQSCRVNPRLFFNVTWIEHNLFRESRREFQNTLRWNYYHWPVPDPYPRHHAKREYLPPVCVCTKARAWENQLGRVSHHVFRRLISVFTVTSYSPFPKRWDSKWSSEWESNY